MILWSTACFGAAETVAYAQNKKAVQTVNTHLRD